MLAIYEQANRSLGRPAFRAFMSRNARQVLDVVVTRLQAIGIVGGGGNPLLEKFVSGFRQSSYEDAVLCYPYKEIIKRLNASVLGKTKRNTTEAEILALSWLEPVFSKQWEMPYNAKMSFRFSRSASSAAIYDYISTEFLLDDIAEFELVKLTEIASKSTLGDIQDICKKVDNPDKKRIDYLYRIVVNSSRAAEINEKTVKALTDSSAKVIADMMAIDTMDRVKFSYDPSWSDDVKISIAMQDMKKDE